ncbi:MAG: flagellar basal body L-ring protein FlgH [Woeseiaceae bacterium]|nr:flagellar basal body L-ring protein FlgH [Woeseiaceae bacterium]
MSNSSNRIQSILCLLGAVALAGCAGPRVEEEIDFEPMPVPQVYSQPTDGTIYRAGTEVRLFEDLKAGRVGDILTVRLVERTNASKNSQTQTAKSTSATLANPTVLGRPITKDGTPLFDGSLEGESTFDGQGASSQSNSLTGDITVTVVDRLPNGNLVIQGEKWLTINQGREFIRLKGVIRTQDIETDNSVASTRIANAQIAYSAKGALADANRMGLIARFFNSVFHPY